MIDSLEQKLSVNPSISYSEQESNFIQLSSIPKRFDLDYFVSMCEGKEEGLLSEKELREFQEEYEELSQDEKDQLEDKVLLSFDPAIFVDNFIRVDEKLILPGSKDFNNIAMEINRLEREEPKKYKIINI